MKRTAIGLLFWVLSFCLFLWNEACAKTIVLEGHLRSKVSIAQRITFRVDRPLAKLSFRFALPAVFSNKSVNQDLQGLNIGIDPDPAKVEDETDAYGNCFKKITWNNLNQDVRINITFGARVKAELSDMESRASFPVESIPQKDMIYLQPTKLVQSASPEIKSRAKELTRLASTQHEAVTAILNYVADNIKYTYNPPQFDARYTLETRSGNCQNFAHLCMALLRAAGIPARIVGGISLKQPWKIPVGENDFLVQSMGQGGHAWMEIYFSDLGWLSYDPQQSKQFTSSRHVKQTHGLDSSDINDSWRASPYLPEYDELIDAKFLDDAVSLEVKHSDKLPKAYLLSNNLLARTGVPQPVQERPRPPLETKETPDQGKPEPPLEIKPEPAVPDKPRPPLEAKKPPEPAGTTPKPALPKVMEFGNMEFPNLVGIYQVVGDKGVRILDKETAEYVTSRYVYAQAFETEETISIDTIFLAMRKFGGDGTVYVDLVADNGGRPSLAGIRSLPVFLENIPKGSGYYWVVFGFPADDSLTLKKGRYWIVLRHSGEVIMNWFYIPGNPYGESDDTRSTLKGYKWQDIQNYDFVFKVRALRQFKGPL